MTVLGWTSRVENTFWPTGLARSEDGAADGDLVGEIEVFLDAGTDVVFRDNPDLAVEAVTDRGE